MSTDLRFPVKNVIPKNLSEAIKKHTGITFGHVYRHKVIVRFKLVDDSFSNRVVMRFDTGADIAIVPEIGEDIKLENPIKHKLRGINPNPDCLVSSKVGKAVAIIEDLYGNRSKA